MCLNVAIRLDRFHSWNRKKRSATNENIEGGFISNMNGVHRVMQNGYENNAMYI